MAITMFLDSIYLNWVQRRFQNASAHSEAAARLLDAGPGPEQGGALNAYFSRNPVLQLLQSNHTWLKLLGNSTGDDDALSRSHAYGNSSRGAAAFDANVREYHPYLVVAMALSLMFLLLICTAYCVLPELRNTHGKNLVSLSSCFIVLYVGFIVDFTFRSRVPQRLCLAMAVVQHTSFLAVFFWTNVMAFDVWQAIVTLRSMANPRIRQDHYWQYAAYAWTATVVVSAPAVLFQFTELVPHEYRPRFGEKKCWLGGYLAYALYFNLPVGIILLCNVVIFGMTAWALYQARTMQKVTLQAKQHKKMFYLYVKLSLVMGIIWVFEFIPWITGYHKLYGLAGLLNSLHGLYLFFIFVFKRKTLSHMQQRLSCCGKPKASATMTKKFSSTTLTSISNCTLNAEP